MRDSGTDHSNPIHRVNHEPALDLAHSRHGRSALGVLLALAVVSATLVIGVASPAPASAQCAPNISVSRTSGLAAGGETVDVSGSCFDVNKGIYVAFCVVPPPGQVPSPCGGGVDQAGASGLSHWISNNPPPYGDGVAQGYGPNGSFNVQMRPAAALNPSVDCRRVQCAVVTRSDHTRTGDRSQDVIVPVSFAADVDQGPPPTEAPAFVPPPTEAPTTVPETTTPLAPETTTTTAPTDTVVAADEEATSELAVDTASAEGSSGSGGVVIVLVVAVLVLLAAGGSGWLVSRRRRSTPGAP